MQGNSLARGCFKEVLTSSLIASAQEKVKGMCREHEKHVKDGVALCCLEGCSMPCL